MCKTLNIALIQTVLIWESPDENKAMLNQKIAAIATTVDLIILPEMFTSGFTMNAHAVAETMAGETIQWLKNKAKEKQAAIIGSLIISENNNYFNRLVCVEPNGKITCYDKRHLFTLAGEHKVYTAGNKKVLFNYKGWKICPLICYDLRFPVWSRNIEDYDVLIYVANWPKARINAWDALLKARSIENMCYAVGVNRVGFDANTYEYPGHSAVFDVLGNSVEILKENYETTKIVTLNKDHITRNRKKLNFLNDSDPFSMT